LWACRPVTSHTDEGCQLLGHIDCNALWGPYPSATLSRRGLASIGPSARHLPLLGRSVVCQESAHPGRESAQCTNADSARHANAGGQLAISHCTPACARFAASVPLLGLNQQSSRLACRLWLGRRKRCQQRERRSTPAEHGNALGSRILGLAYPGTRVRHGASTRTPTRPTSK